VTDEIDDANGGAGAVVGAADVVVVTRAVLVVGAGAVVAVVDVLVEVASLDEDEPDRDAVVVVPVACTGAPVVARTRR
jgi:hypothetical protein